MTTYWQSEERHNYVLLANNVEHECCSIVFIPQTLLLQEWPLHIICHCMWTDNTEVYLAIITCHCVEMGRQLWRHCA